MFNKYIGVCMMLLFVGVGHAVKYDYYTNTSTRFAQRTDAIIATLVQTGAIPSPDVHIAVCRQTPDEDTHMLKQYLVMRKYWPDKFIKYLQYRESAATENALALSEISAAEVDKFITKDGDTLLAEEQKYIHNSPVMIPYTPYLLVDGKALDGDLSFDTLAVVTGKGVKIDKQNSEVKNIQLDRPIISNRLDVFIMADCPFGVAAIKALYPCITSCDIQVHYELKLVTADADIYARYDSMHGVPEVEESLRQLAVRQLYPQKYWQYMINREARSTRWPELFKQLNMDIQKIENYIKTKECMTIADKDAALAEELKMKVSPAFLWQNNLLLTNANALKQIKEFEKMELQSVSGTCSK